MDSGVNELVAKARWVARAVRQRRWITISIAWIVAIVCAAGISIVPERFEASARIYVDTQTVLKPMMKDLAYQPDIDQQVRMLARTLISRPNVERLLDRREIGFTFGSPVEREKTLARLMDQIKIVAAERGNLYSVAYRDTDRERALRLVEGTVALFVNSGSEGKKQDSIEAGHFIDEQIRTNEAKLVEAEGRLKDFKVRNFGVSGVSNQDYFARMSTLSDEVNKLRSDLPARLAGLLAEEPPQLPLASGMSRARLLLGACAWPQGTRSRDDAKMTPPAKAAVTPATNFTREFEVMPQAPRVGSFWVVLPVRDIHARRGAGFDTGAASKGCRPERPYFLSSTIS